MSEGMNKVILIGNLGADPELRMTQGGQALLKLRLATTESYLDKDNTRQERTEWHSVTLWGKRGEGLSKILKKGDRLCIEGGIRTTSYEKDNEKRYRTEVNATNVILCGSRGGSVETDEEPAPRRRPPPPAPPRAQTRGRAAPVPPQANEYAESYGETDDIPF